MNGWLTGRLLTKTAEISTSRNIISCDWTRPPPQVVTRSGQPHRVSLAQSDQLQILDYSPRPVKLRGEIVSFHHLSQASFIQYDIMYGYIQKYYELKESLL